MLAHRLSGEGSGLRVIDRSLFEVSQNGYRGTVGSCRHCGWARDEHPGHDSGRIIDDSEPT